jgi:hypothetical protein
MSLYASLSGHRVIKARVEIPAWGCPWADATIDVSDTIDTQTSLVIGDLTMVCAVTRQASTTGSRSARVVCGHGGWSTMVSARQYHISSGVPLSMIVGDLARESGEVMAPYTDSRINQWYMRPSWPASFALNDLAGPRGWYVGLDGRTVIGQRPSATVTTKLTAVSYSGAPGVVVVAADDIAQLLPGATIITPTIGTRTISCVVHELDSGQLRTEIMVTP